MSGFEAIGSEVKWSNFVDAWTLVPFGRFIFNGFFVALCGSLLSVIVAVLSAYAFSRLRFKYRDRLFLLYVLTLVLPQEVLVVPLFIMMNQLGLVDTLLGITLPSLFMTPFAVFFLRQFFLGISREVEEAAKIDGASHWRIFLRLIVPMSAAPLTTLAILTFISAWNEYLWPLLIAKDQAAQPLTVALGIFRSQTPGGSPDWPGLMAMTLLAALPIIILFIIFGRRVVNSIQFSGIK